MVMQACKLHLPHPHPSSEVTSLLYEPHSRSLALMHSDSSILLFPSLSPFSPPPSSSPPPPTQIPPTSISTSTTTSSSFLRLISSTTTTHTLFIVSSPNPTNSSISLLRFWILSKTAQIFTKPNLQSNQKDLIVHGVGGGVSVPLNGVSLKLYSSVNFFALYSISARQILIFGVKAMVGDEEKEDSVSVKLMKCAVIDCMAPICSVSFSLGYLLLGENNGVRVFPLRMLAKGGVTKHRRKREKNNQNGTTRSLEENAGDTSAKNGTTKLRTVKLKHDSSVEGALFVAFTSPEIQNQKSMAVLRLSLKAVSIHALSHSSFLVLDSLGDLHLLSLYSSSPGSETTGQMRRLSHSMKVQLLAVLPDLSARTHTVWISDGFYSIHVMSVSDMDVTGNENDQSENGEDPMRILAMQTIFASVKIHDLIPLSANAALVLGQGNVYAYAIS